MMACLVQGITVKTYQESLVEQREFKKNRIHRGDKIGAVIELLKYLNETNATAMNQSTFSSVAEHFLRRFMANDTDWEKMMKKINRAFTYLDTDKNGMLSEEEIVDCLWMLVDRDGDGEISAKEAIRMVRAYAKHLGVKLAKGWTKKVKGAIAYVDKDKSGGVTLRELETVLS